MEEGGGGGGTEQEVAWRWGACSRRDGNLREGGSRPWLPCFCHLCSLGRTPEVSTYADEGNAFLWLVVSEVLLRDQPTPLVLGL